MGAASIIGGPLLWEQRLITVRGRRRGGAAHFPRKGEGKDEEKDVLMDPPLTERERERERKELFALNKKRSEPLHTYIYMYIYMYTHTHIPYTTQTVFFLFW